MGLAAGKLRHRVTVQLPQISQDPVSGDEIKTWVSQWFNVPAGIEYLSVKDLIAADAVQSKIVARITLRYKSGYSQDMRVLHGSSLFSPAGFTRDSDSGLEFVVLPCSQGVINVD